MKPRLWAVVVGVTLLAAALTARADEAVSARLDSIATAFTKRGFAGAVLVTRGSDTLLDRGYGEADRDAHVPNGPELRYPIGSLTKQFTAAAVMRLVEQGRLSTSDSISRWLVEAGPAWQGVTVRDLLSHTGGIPDAQDDSDFVRAGREGSPGHLAVLRYARRPLDFPPGTGFHYSNTGYQLLGAIVEAAGGEPYETFVERQLLVPLGLSETRFDTLPPNPATDAVGYWNHAETVKPAPAIDLRFAYGAGGLVSTTHDFVHWELALTGGQVLRDSARTEMLTPVSGDYAYGIHHRTTPGREAYYHSGKIGGFESLLGCYPADSVAIAILANQTAGWRIDALYDALATTARKRGP